MVGMLKKIAEAHELYGATHQDWERYGRLCCSNAKAIRRCHAAQLACTKNGKFVGKHVPTSAEPGTVAIELCLWEAERAWSHYMRLRGQVQKYGASSSSVANRQLQHAKRRLQVAFRYAKGAVELAERISNGTHDSQDVNPEVRCLHAECSAYTHWIAGLLASEERNWTECFVATSIAASILERLARKPNGSVDTVYQRRIDVFLNPLLKFALYNLKREDKPEPAVTLPLFMERLQSNAGISLVSGIVAQDEAELKSPKFVNAHECFTWTNKILTNCNLRLPSAKLDRLIEKFARFFTDFGSSDFPCRPLIQATESFIHALKLWSLSQNQSNLDDKRKFALLSLELLGKLLRDFTISQNSDAIFHFEYSPDKWNQKITNLSSTISQSVSRVTIKAAQFRTKLEGLSMQNAKPDCQYVECKPIYFDLAYNYVDI